MAPRPSVMLARGLVRGCPRCGGKRLFEGWFTMTDHCPTCGLRFEREEGFFLGAWVMNYAAASLVVAIVLVAVIAIEVAHPGANLVPIALVGMASAVITPIVCYPFSKTLWVAIELIMRPLDPREVAAADQVEADTKNHQIS